MPDSRHTPCATPSGNAVNDFHSEHSVFGPLSPGTPGERVGVRGLASRAKKNSFFNDTVIVMLAKDADFARDANPLTPALSPGVPGERGPEMPHVTEKIVHGVALRGKDGRTEGAIVLAL